MEKNVEEKSKKVKTSTYKVIWETINKERRALFLTATSFIDAQNKALSVECEYKYFEKTHVGDLGDINWPHKCKEKITLSKIVDIIRIEE